MSLSTHEIDCLNINVLMCLAHRSNVDQKTQTTKDLAKPWSQLADGLHSALTTILLDDSPLKARLQPYNHVCIPEYNGKARGKDLQSKSSVIEKLEHVDSPLSIPDKQSGQGSDISVSSPDTEVCDITAKPAKTDREIRRKEKKERKKLEKAATKAARQATPPRGLFDETLLAVIGILDEIKQQKNVAAWIKHGGLWAGNVPAVESAVGRDNALGGVGGESINRPESPTDAEVEDDGETHTLPPPSSQPTMVSSSPPSSPSTKSETSSRISKRQRSIGNDDRSEDPKKGRPSHPEESFDSEGHGEATIMTGNDAFTSSNEQTAHIESSSNSLKADTHASSETKKDTVDASLSEKHNLWFEHPETLRYWVTRGRYALNELGIREEDGVEMDDSYFAETYKH